MDYSTVDRWGSLTMMDYPTVYRWALMDFLTVGDWESLI